MRPAAASPSSRVAARYAHGPTSSPTVVTTSRTTTGSGTEVCSASQRNPATMARSAPASSATHPGRSRPRARPGGGAGGSEAPAEEAWWFTDRS
jgi:hypothetical protein